jgi:hypothetical protein
MLDIVFADGNQWVESLVSGFVNCDYHTVGDALVTCLEYEEYPTVTLSDIFTVAITPLLYVAEETDTPDPPTTITG